MNLVYENLSTFENFIKCSDVNRSGIRRFTPSTCVGRMTNGQYSKEKDNLYSIENRPKQYIIATGVGHNPNDWTGINNRHSVLAELDARYLDDLTSGKALLCIDQSLEGYQTDWLWEHLHNDCLTHGVSPSSLIYITGNAKAAEQYRQWSQGLSSKMLVVPYECFELDLSQVVQEGKVKVTWDDIIAYKQNNDIKLYDCLNKRPRAHRSWFYLQLYKDNLLEQGIVTMNDYGIHIPDLDGRSPDQKLLLEARTKLPLMYNNTPNNELDDGHYIRRVLPDLYKQTWVSVVTEPQFADSDLSVFCSEKIFKPIACLQPFIVVGGKGSLKRLRELGYKTFDGWIDESYDRLDSHQRLEAISQALKKISAIQNKLEWFKGMRSVLEHNQRLLAERKHPQAWTTIRNYYKDYFNV